MLYVRLGGKILISTFLHVLKRTCKHAWILGKIEGRGNFAVLSKVLHDPRVVYERQKEPLFITEQIAHTCFWWELGLHSSPQSRDQIYSMMSLQYSPKFINSNFVRIRNSILFHMNISRPIASFIHKVRKHYCQPLTKVPPEYYPN